MSSVAVVILTYNEELNLGQALGSVTGWADEIFVLDSYSSDSTVDIAQRFSCAVVKNHFEDYAKQRNFALEKLPIQSEWVFFLDADEWVPEELKQEISRLISSSPSENGFYIKRRLIWMKRWIRRGYYPTWILRLFRRGAGRCEDRQVNEHMIVKGQVGFLENDFMHEDRKGITDWISKHNSYSTREAQELFGDFHSAGYEELPARLFGTQPERKRWIRQKLWLHLPPLFRAFCYFLFRFVIKGGFLDGKEAFIYHFLQGLWYTLLIDAKYLELREIKGDTRYQLMPEAKSQTCDSQPDDVGQWHSQMAAEFDSKYSNSRPSFIERYNIWTRMIDDYSKSDGYVLDVGCGSGVLSLYAATKNKNVVGVDVSEEMIRICERKKSETDLANITFIKSDIHDLSGTKAGEADIVLCSSVLEYMEDLHKTLDILVSLLKRKGILMVSMPNKSSIYRNLEPTAYGITGLPKYYKYVRHVLSLERTSEILSNHGLTIVLSTYYGKTPLLSALFRSLGLTRYSDNLFLVVAEKH
ncbi:MAG TPA: methyltransferase domain-containing protein [Desulfomonilaceae bacterium]|nr:methyltransferase domain-containing protein [Desulfomonilaceae bacterium]